MRPLALPLLPLLVSAALAGPAAADLLEVSVRIRDFSSTHPDFESSIGVDFGFVADQLGPDGKPVYIGPPGGTLTTTGPDNFNQWFNDVEGVNTATVTTLVLDNGMVAPGGLYEYFSSAFFPIDGQLFGNEGLTHNYHFTLELHSTFTYQPGLTFTFTGDDDLFAYVNGQLVIDLGGVHGALSGTVNLDTLGLVPGEEYDFDLFFAERHTDQSNFRVQTSIVFEGSCPTQASWTNYGAGSHGTNGMPGLRASGSPILGTTIEILAANTDVVPQHACVVVGLAPDFVPTIYGSPLLIDPQQFLFLQPVMLAPFPLETPISFTPGPDSCGVPLFGQMMQIDSTAGIAFSPGIHLMPGI